MSQAKFVRDSTVQSPMTAPLQSSLTAKCLSYIQNRKTMRKRVRRIAGPIMVETEEADGRFADRKS
jgi:hypothetical protein